MQSGITIALNQVRLKMKKIIINKNQIIMKKLSIFIVNLVLVFGLSTAAFAEGDSDEASHIINFEIPTSALIDIEGEGGNTNITLTPTAPTEAGLGYDFSTATDNSLWLNYSSIVEKGQKRKITATLNDGNKLPTGLTLSVLAADATNDGNGDKGRSTGSAVELNNKAKKIITGIGSCYTGDGVSKGSNLTYSLKFNDNKYKNLVAENHNLTVTYTITDTK